ncbi:MAG: choice-of-anchor D domain-containing protein, partial [Negativicutes bacterium]|nr:choice-of-anchor D domain-containing protein [Negativicutes bacterium]
MKNGHAEAVGRQASRLRRSPSIFQKLLIVSLAVMPLILINGCAGVVTPKTGAGGGSTASFSLSPASINFGKVASGQKTSQTATVTNTGNVALTIQSATFSNPEFSLSGATFPMPMAVGQSATVTLWFNGTTVGNASGTLSVLGATGSTPFVVNLSGTVTTTPQPQLTLSSGSLSFGTVSVGNKGNANLTVSNTGTADLVISLITMGGPEFGISGITTPKTITAGQSVPVTATF